MVKKFIVHLDFDNLYFFNMLMLLQEIYKFFSIGFFYRKFRHSLYIVKEFLYSKIHIFEIVKYLLQSQSQPGPMAYMMENNWADGRLCHMTK